MPAEFQRKTLLCHYADCAYADDPAEPSEEIGEYRLMQQGRRYQLIRDGSPVPPDRWLVTGQ